MAQMTVAVALGDEAPDHWSHHYQDTLTAGRGLCNEVLSRLLCEEGPECIREMDSWGVGWARKNGKITSAFAPGHDRPRCVYVDFLNTGPAVSKTLRMVVNRTAGIHKAGDLLIVDLVRQHGEVLCQLVEERPNRLPSSRCMLDLRPEPELARSRESAGLHAVSVSVPSRPDIPAIGSLHHLGLPFEIAQTIALTIYSRFLHARNAARAKWAGLQAARDALAPYVDEETLERESKRIAAALEMSLEMKIIHVHPYKNPLLFFGNAFDLSPKSLGKMLVEASLQASDVLDREGFPMP